MVSRPPHLPSFQPLSNVYKLTVKILEFPAQALHCRMFGVDAPLGGWKPEHVEILNQSLDQLTPSSDQLFLQVSAYSRCEVLICILWYIGFVMVFLRRSLRGSFEYVWIIKIYCLCIIALTLLLTDVIFYLLYAGLTSMN